MRGRGFCGVKLIALVLIHVMLVLSVLSPSVSASEHNSSGAVKHNTSHDIAIVFDNSGSMYENESWCQALYAMEVFASMLDYNYDKLGIYPMGPIQIGKSGKPISDRIDISSKDDVKKIESLYSKKTSETILKPAYTASEYLQKSNLDEKWLIVLTDGAFFFDKDSSKEEKAEKSAEWLSGKLVSFAGQSGISVQYLGFAGASKLSDNESKHFYSTNANTADELTGELVKICNKIFQRNAISNVLGGSFSIDVSMTSIIAFVQGKGAKIGGLTKPDGKAAEPSMETKLEASTMGTGNKKYSAPIADVAGQVITYSNCEAGEYKFDYTGSNIQVFYEPNVMVKTELVDSNGEIVDLEQKVYPGDYTLNYALVDAATGKDVTDSPLLTPVSLNAKVLNNGKENNMPSGSTIALDADSETEIDINGTFLRDYTISNSNENGVFRVNVQPPELDTGDLKVKVLVNNFDFGHKWYKYSNYEEWKPIRVEVSYKGEPLSDEILESSTAFTLDPKDKAAVYKTEIIPGESAFNIYLGIDENGEYVKPDSGKYKLTADVSITDEYGREVRNNGNDSFEVQGYSSIWRWLIYIVLLAALILLTLFILNLPAWPRRMRYVVEKPKVDEGLKATIKINSTGMRIIPYEDALRCSAKKNSKVKDWLFKPKSMSIIAYNFSSEEIRMFKTGGHNYSDSGEGFKCKGIENEILFNGSQFEFTFLNGTKGSGHIEIY